MSTRIFYPVLALLAVTALLWATLAAAPPPLVDLGTSGDSRSLGGFYDAERSDGTSFRWSGPDARLVLHGSSPGAALLALRISGERLVAQGQPEVALVRDERNFGAFHLVSGWRIYQILLPPGATATTAGTALPINLRTAVSRPGADEDGRDYRTLGAPVDWVRLAPIVGAPDGALARALGLSWIVALAAALVVAFTTGRTAPQAGGLRSHDAGLIATSVILSLGLALVLWAWRDPHGLAYRCPGPVRRSAWPCSANIY